MSPEERKQFEELRASMQMGTDSRDAHMDDEVTFGGYEEEDEASEWGWGPSTTKGKGRGKSKSRGKPLSSADVTRVLALQHQLLRQHTRQLLPMQRSENIALVIKEEAKPLRHLVAVARRL